MLLQAEVTLENFTIEDSYGKEKYGKKFKSNLLAFIPCWW